MLIMLFKLYCQFLSFSNSFQWVFNDHSLFMLSTQNGHSVEDSFSTGF